MGRHRGLEFRGRIRDLGAILLRRSFRALGKPHDLVKDSVSSTGQISS